jgi:hypothetical protein
MASAQAECEVTLFYKDKKSEDGEALIVKQLALGWNVEESTVGIIIDPNTVYIIPLAELEGMLVQYPEKEEDDAGDATDLELDAEEEGTNAESGGKVYVPNFGGSSDGS